MLPEALSTDRTSLNQSEDRPAMVVDMAIDDDGDGRRSRRCIARRCGTTRSWPTPAVAAWLDGHGPAPAAIGQRRRPRAPAADCRIALAGAPARRGARREGALDFDRTEIKPVMGDGVVKDLQVDASNRARDMIESFMIAANGVTARFLTAQRLGLDPPRRARARSGGRASSRSPPRTARRCRPSPTRARSKRSCAAQRAAQPETFPICR